MQWHYKISCHWVGHDTCKVIPATKTKESQESKGSFQTRNLKGLVSYTSAKKHVNDENGCKVYFGVMGYVTVGFSLSVLDNLEITQEQSQWNTV